MQYSYGRDTSSSPQPSRLSLDAVPSAPTDRIKPPAPGDETMSILGAPNVNGEDVGISASTPTGIALGGIMKMMQGANDIQTVVPGAIPPPILQLIQQLSLTLPEIVRNMQQMTGPGGMLSTMGAGGMGGMGGMNGMNPMSGGGAGAPIAGEGAMQSFM